MIRCRSQLQGDQRGMVLVVALPMAALLVACLWYLISVGDAVLHRERLQDTADATAFESAVLHARAMNTEVSLNLLGASLAAVPAALDVVGQGRALLELASGTERALGARVAESAQIVSDTQLALRALAPLLATSEATRNNSLLAHEYRAADGAIALSFAALPTAEQATLTADAREPWLLTAAAAQHVEPHAAARLPLRAAQPSAAFDVLPRGAADEPTSPARQLGTTLEIDPRAQNGNALFQTWSIARSDRFAPERADERGMSLASPARPVQLAANNAAFAQAEYYFDCADSWEHCAADAAWMPRWTARLRRFERPDGEHDRARARELAKRFTHASAALDRVLQRTQSGRARDYIRALFEAPPCGRGPCLH